MIIKKGQSKAFWTEERCHITEILNHSHVKNLSLAQASVQPLITTQVHSLDCDEIYYILSGNGILHLDGSDFPLSSGDAAYIRKGKSQSITNPSPCHDLIFLCICTPRFEPDYYTSLE